MSSQPTAATVAGRCHRPFGSVPSGNSQSSRLVRTRNVGQYSWSTTATQPRGSAP